MTLYALRIGERNCVSIWMDVLCKSKTGFKTLLEITYLKSKSLLGPDVFENLPSQCFEKEIRKRVSGISKIQLKSLGDTP